MRRSRLSPGVARVFGEKSAYDDLSRYNATPRHRYYTVERDGVFCVFCEGTIQVGTVAVRFPPKWATRHLECKSGKPKPWKIRERI